jgi:DNA-binding response OmpR family regulator
MSKTNDANRSAAPTPTAMTPAGGASRRGKRVLVVDDERDLSELISFNLTRNGYDVITAFDGNGALAAARAEPLPDLIVLDVMLPGIDGTEVTRQLKADPRTAGIPIVLLTAKSEETDVVVGLKLGADDYVTKPFSMKILLARLESLSRRLDQSAAPAANATLRAGPLEIDPNKHEVYVDGRDVKLTLTEFKLLSALVSARGRVLSRDQLMDKAMGTDVFVTDRAIDVHVTAIRKKLGDAAKLVHTVRGVGYRLREDADAAE